MVVSLDIGISADSLFLLTLCIIILPSVFISLGGWGQGVETVYLVVLVWELNILNNVL